MRKPSWCLCAFMVSSVLLSGCVATRPFTPFPQSVVVAKQGQVDGKRSYDDLRDAYTTSPNRNPDGLGTFEAIEPRSRFTLWVGELEAKREEANRVAYARSPEEQAAALAQAHQFHAEHVVFEGQLIAPTAEFTNARWYMPEGVYLVDDQGRKFKPERVDEGAPKSERLIYMPPVNQYTSTADIPRWVTGTPRLVFPAAAITEQTKAVTLYFAAAGLRFSFTWIFDPRFTPGGSPESSAGGGMNRLFNKP